jgi:hypothetical protein
VPIGEDDVFAVDTVATATGGAELELSLRVERALRWDDPDATELLGLLSGFCPPELAGEDRLADERWSLVAARVSATTIGDMAWPADSVLSVTAMPASEQGRAAIAAEGASVLPPEEFGENGICSVPARINGAGEALIVFGIAGDFEDDTPPEIQGTLWSGYKWGFAAVNQAEPTEVTFADCSVAKTPLGEELSAPEVPFGTIEDASECSGGYLGD